MRCGLKGRGPERGPRPCWAQGVGGETSGVRSPLVSPRRVCCGMKGRGPENLRAAQRFSAIVIRNATNYEAASTSKVSVRHEVENDVDAERIGAFLREFSKEVFIFTFPFPAITVVGVVGRNDHNSAFGVQDCLIAHLGSLHAVV